MPHDDDFRKVTKAQRASLAGKLETLGLRSADRDTEIRIDYREPRNREMVDLLVRYRLISVRPHGDGHSLVRVALTNDGAKVLAEREKMTQTASAAAPAIQGGGIEPVDLPPDPVRITTQTLQSFAQTARERGYSRQLTDETLDSLDVNGWHRVQYAWKHVSSEGQRNMRLQLQLQIKTAVMPEPETREAIMDISSRDWDMLMVPHQQRVRKEGVMHGANNILYMTPPKWEAVRSYPVVHEITSFYQGHVAAYNRTGWTGPFSIPSYEAFNLRSGNRPTTLRGDDALDFMRHPRSLYNAEFAEYLQVAHPVVIDPDWVEIQEDWSESEAWAYAQRMVLPFDPIYLDFMGAGGRLPDVHTGKTHVGITGCLIYTDQDGNRVIAPVGGRQYLDPALTTDVLAGGLPWEPLGRVIISGTRCPYGERVISRDPDTGEETQISGAYTIPARIENLIDEAIALDLPTFRHLSTYPNAGEVAVMVDDLDATPGYVELPLRPEEAFKAIERTDADTMHGYTAEYWNALLRVMAVKSISMLSLLDNENVELRKVDVSRQVRREVSRQQKKGKQIDIASEIVVVRKTRYVDGHKESSEGGGIEYSHQFRVRRHEQHHGPHTRTYRAHPELAKPCARCGSCRRFIIDSYIKGPANKPLKEKKTYVFRDKEQAA